VLLLRDCPHPPDGRAPLQVFLQRRVAGMAFAGGMTVFPGGGVDATDREDVPWTGPGAAWWGDRLACAPENARALVQAAVRETFEECGVLLTGDSPDGAWLAGAREDLVARRCSLGDLLRASGLQLRSDLLHPWARWITPEGLPRRYDTAFLVARVPDGQVADDRTTEAVEASWWHPADALAGAVAGDLELMTPTQHTLQELAGHADAGSVIAAAAERRIEAVTPRARRVGGQVVIVVPDGPGGELPTGQPR
jgi:8-oxo-dGTP pyrophosphatase MutT (NUDIX family)